MDEWNKRMTMQTALMYIVIILQALCTGQELCNMFPKNSIIPHGSDLIMFYKAPFNSICRQLAHFDIQEVYWKLNNQIINKRFYRFNSTFASVLISKVSVERVRVECFFDDLVLDGTFIRTSLPPSSPQNVSCTAVPNYTNFSIQVTCTWDDDRNTADAKYTLRYKVSKRKEEMSECRGKICEFSIIVTMGGLSVTLTTENPAGQSHSDEVFYESILTIIQLDPPINVQVSPGSNVLTVRWEHKHQPLDNDWECEVRSIENGSYIVPVVKHVGSSNTYELTEVKPCTYYTVSVRCRLQGAVWSGWSTDVTAVTSVDVSSAVQIQVFRTESILRDDGNRTVHLMWKTVPLSCEAFIEYRLCDYSSRSVKPNCSNPARNHEFMTVDGRSHVLTVTGFYNQIRLDESSIVVPSTEKDVSLPPLHNISVFVQHPEIHVTWQEPGIPISGYITVWNSTSTDHMWQHSREPSVTLKGEPYILYTISLTPVYEKGPGTKVTLHNYTKEGNLTQISTLDISIISDREAEIHWLPIFPTQCCAFVINYTVFYKALHESEPRSVTVSEKQNRVILEDLQPSTAYTVSVMASSRTSASMSSPKTFSTKLYSQSFLTVIIACGVGLTMLPVLAVLALMIRKKYQRMTIPNPGHGTLSAWVSEDFNKTWAKILIPLNGNSDNIVPCEVDTEVIGNSPASNTDPALLDEWTNDQNLSLQNRPRTPNAALIVSTDNHQPVIQLLPAVDVCPFEYSHLPPDQSPYAKQTPLNSPVESPTQTFFEDQTEVLLKQSPKHSSSSTVYVTIDFF